jgi:uncharacterized RDD family membrane protein YckC
MKNPSNPLPEFVTPGLPRIMAAMGYDSLLLAAISIGYSALVVGLRVMMVGQPEEGHRIEWDLLSGSLVTLGWFAVLIGFYIYFWHRFGQTLGMKTWRIQVIDSQTHQLPTYPQATKRAFGALLSLALLGFGYWCQLIHPKRRLLHDLLSGTQLILLKKN